MDLQSYPWFRSAVSLGRLSDRYCTCCDHPLKGHAVRMLELDQRTQTYHDFGGVPEDKSQGWFPFGLKCAKNKIEQARAKIGEHV